MSVSAHTSTPATNGSQQGDAETALTVTFVKQVKWGSVNKSEDKHSDGGGMHLLEKASGKYWRMVYRHLGKQKTLGLGA